MVVLKFNKPKLRCGRHLPIGEGLGKRKPWEEAYGRRTLMIAGELELSLVIYYVAHLGRLLKHDSDEL